MKEKFKRCLSEFFDDDKSEKVIFIGSGFSKNLGLPTWEEFAYMHLDILKDNNKINFETYELLKKENFRTVISMAKHNINKDNNLKERANKMYEEIFKISYNENEFDAIANIDKLSEASNKDFKSIVNFREKVNRIKRIKAENEIFKQIYDLNMINVTTNYDDILDILAEDNNEIISSDSKRSVNKVFYSEKDFKLVDSNPSIIKSGQVFHIHGSINEISTMIVSNEDYIVRYWSGENVYKNFLKKIFEEYNVIFLGYSLQELEILNYLFEGEKNKLDKTDKQRILILDSFDYEIEKLDFLSRYYEDNYCIKLCTYSKSKMGYNEITNTVRLIKEIKNDIEEKKEGYKRCLELIKMIN
ncbi:SIR2 family protein [Clostridium sp. LIBA-8841]|uniref:SIR2 family protein n=1 Tax=Clostridium sp. LIBA-8841 TaxID=2987530 RepID=UPI002AC5EAAB|nr:SIR2 family protein [Clostridium sp. LIBA-8841]MDZ5253804.1 SIR2 family protein [Clostridium sp. LIBA-8841]